MWICRVFRQPVSGGPRYWILSRRKSFGVWLHVGKLLLSMSEYTMCCLRPLSVTERFLSTVMPACGPMCRVRCRDVLLCYDSSAVSDVQRSTPVFHSLVVLLVLTTATHHSPGYVPALSTSVGAQRRCQTNSSIFSVRSRQSNAVKPSLPERIDFKLAVLIYQRLDGLAPQYSFWPHPARRWF